MNNVQLDPRALEVLLALDAELGECIIAGGAARDIAHSRVPKDYDICLLTCGASDSDNYEEYANDVARYVRRALPLAGDLEVFETYRGGSGRLIFCIKFGYKGLEFDLLEYCSQPSNPEQQVAEFDTTLNGVWIALEGDAVILRTTPAFDAIRNGEQPVRPLRSCDGDIPARLAYLREKYPQYNFSEELV